MKKLLIFVFLGVLFLVIAFGGYATWNAMDPADSCGSCHEVRPTFERWKVSAHSEISCLECHGTALSNGVHSLREKLGMVFTHMEGSKTNDDVRLTEAQSLDVMARCAKCHQSEFAKWQSGAHSTSYANIFEDAAHNKMEKPYWDCMRCHGMLYKGDVNSLMDLSSEDWSKWKIKDRAQAALPSIPCMACHQVHSPNPTSGKFKSAHEDARKISRKPKTSFYVRTQGAHIPTDMLTPIEIYLNNEDVEKRKCVQTSKDPNAQLCMQCHSPNWRGVAHSEDDFTPTGVHEGISCVSCHDPHSNSAQNSCVKCHASKSKNCKIDVMKADTSYKSKDSKADIHKMTCSTCHAEKNLK